MLAWGDNRPKSLIDVGSGAGFPGIPLKIIFPTMQLTLVESVGKKTKFCQHIVDILNLEHVNIIQDRAEVLGQNPKYREKFEWAVARAVANLPVLVEFLLPLARLGGGVIAQKG
jgi:16S rRNA (guanine527-N7)-methyltransferase